jgi:hypothetical protein
MAGQTSVILKGFDYQHLLSWYHILSLKTNKSIIRIKLENHDAGYVDDLTVEKAGGFADFYQIKYHVQIGHYSMETLLNAGKGLSLMEKFWVTWNRLATDHPLDKIRLILYSNWLTHPDDEILLCISGDSGHLNDTFFAASPTSECGVKKEEWKKAHGADDQLFESFSRSISFQLGRNMTDEMKQVIAERMQLCGLKSDDNAMLIAVGVVKNWIKAKKKDIQLSDLEEVIRQHNLRATAPEKAATIYFTTVKSRKFDLEPDYLLDWRPHFKENDGVGGHELIDRGNWNALLLPELSNLEERINTDLTPTLIRARGFSRLSPWFAFGHTFSEVAGYTIEISQQGKLWRTDEAPSPEMVVTAENDPGELLAQANKVVAVGISVTGAIDNAVRDYIETNGGVDAVLLLRPTSAFGPTCFQTGGDVTAFCQQVKTLIRDFVRRHDAERLLIFYFGPLSGACFLGHQLNAICMEIQIMEHIHGTGYEPSFLLR